MKPKLLLVENFPPMSAAVASLLQGDFDVVASLANGQAAVEAATLFMPDIVILDVSMPIVEGPEVARRLKVQGCKAKIVFISVSTDVHRVAGCLAAGGDAYVSKMRLVSDLTYALNEVLAGRTFVSPGPIEP